MEDTSDLTYPDGGSSSSQQLTTLQELNIGNLRKQLLSQCDFSVADIESWKSMGLSVKDLKHLELDDLLKSPVLTPSYQVTKFQWLQTQLEASALDKTHSLSAHNSLVDTVTITNQNFLKVSEESEKSFVTENSELSAVKLEEMLGTIKLSDVNNIQQCLTQFNLTERPESETSVPAISPVSSHLSFADTSPEKCAIANSHPASILNHLSTDLSEELSDNGCASLFTDDVLKQDPLMMDKSFSTDNIPRTGQAESSRRKSNQENMKPKLSDGGKRDYKHPLNRYEESKNVSSVPRAHDKVNDIKTPRSEQTLEYNAGEKKVCDHVVLNLPPTKATDRTDCTRKEIVHSNKNEESVVKSVIISFSQEKVKVITGLVKEDVRQPMKDLVQVTTGLGTKEINTLEQEKGWREYPPINLSIDPLVSRELDALASFRDDIDDARTPANFTQSNGEEIIRNEESCAAEIKTILPPEKAVLHFEEEKNAEGKNETKTGDDCYSSGKLNRGGHHQNNIDDLNRVAQDRFMKNETSQKMEVENDNLTEISSRHKICDNYKELNTTITDVVEEAKYKNSNFIYTNGINESADTDMNGTGVVTNYSEESRDLYEEKVKEDSINETTKIEVTGVIDKKDTSSFEQNDRETHFFSENVQSYVNCQNENVSSVNHFSDEKNVQLNAENKQVVNDSENSDSFYCPDKISNDHNECVDDLRKDTIKMVSLINENGEYRYANGVADINAREITETKYEKRNHKKDSDTQPIEVFEENAKRLSEPVEDIDGRIFVVKMAVATCKTEGAATKCQLQTLETNKELKLTESPKPFHLTASTSSILTVNNHNIQPSSSLCITYEIQKDFPEAEQSIISQEKVDVITSKFSPADNSGSDTKNTFIESSSPIDESRILEYHEAPQSIDFLKTTTVSSNDTADCSPAPINSSLPDLNQTNVGNQQAKVIDVADETVIKTDPISDLESISAVQSNMQSVETEKQTQEAICLKTSPDIINLLITCPQLITDAPETVEPMSTLIKNDLDANVCKTKENLFETQHEDAISGLKKDDPSCLALKETDVEKYRPLNLSDCNSEQESMTGITPDVASAEKEINAEVQVGMSVSPVRIPEISACAEVRVSQKNETQNVEPVTKSVTSKVEITTSHMIRQPQEDLLNGKPNEKGARRFEQEGACQRLWESSDNSVKICHFSQSQKPPSPSTVIKEILRTESSQIFRTENERKIFAKSVEFSKSLQKESTRFKVTKNIYQVQQRKSSYGQMKMIEKGLKNIPARKYRARETRETSFEKDAKIAHKIQQMTSVPDVSKTTSQRKQNDVQNSKKIAKSIIKNVNILEPMKSQKNKEVPERNSNPKNNLKKSISLNLKNEKTITVPTEVFGSQSSGDTIYQERILSGNYYESEKSDGKGDICDKFSAEDNIHYSSKDDGMISHRNSKTAKQSSVQCISMTECENKGKLCDLSVHNKNLKKTKYLQARLLESCQGTLSPAWLSSREMSPQTTPINNRVTRSLTFDSNSPNSLPKVEKTIQHSHSCSLQKLCSKEFRIPSSSGFHPQCNSPEFDMELVSSEQRENCSHVTTKKITEEEDLLSCMRDHSDSSSSTLAERNQDGRYTPFSLGNQVTTSSSDLTVFPISCTEIRNEKGKMYTYPNLNDYKTNRSFPDQGHFLRTLCSRFRDNVSPDDSTQGPKSKKATYLTESIFDNLSRKKRHDLYEQSAPLPPPPSPPSPPKGLFQRPCNNLESDLPPIPKTFGKGDNW